MPGQHGKLLMCVHDQWVTHDIMGCLIHVMQSHDPQVVRVVRVGLQREPMLADLESESSSMLAVLAQRRGRGLRVQQTYLIFISQSLTGPLATLAIHWQPIGNPLATNWQHTATHWLWSLAVRAWRSLRMRKPSGCSRLLCSKRPCPSWSCSGSSGLNPPTHFSMNWGFRLWSCLGRRCTNT